MSQIITVNVTRVTQPSQTPTTIVSGAVVQLDALNPRLATDYKGNHPFDTFDAYVTYLPPTIVLSRADLFTDALNTDPSTNQKAAYRIISRPEAFPDGHIECVVEQFVGVNS